ncbi:MAG: hypothetical protein V4582_06005 [Pseudomonadota bacterium]
MSIMHIQRFTTHSHRKLKSRSAIATGLLALGLTLLAFQTQAGDTLSDAKMRFQQEMAACNRGETNQDRPTCQKEARAAYQEAKTGKLNDDPATFQANAERRCIPLEPDDRALCLKRVRGNGPAAK